MNITFFTENMGTGGAQRVISVLSNYFCEENNITIILTDKTDPPIAYKLDKRITIVGYNDWSNQSSLILKKLRILNYKIKCRLIRKKADFFEQYLYFQLMADSLRAFLKKIKTDTLISFLVKPNIIVGLCAKHIDAKIIMAERNYPARPEFNGDFIKLRNKCYLKANKCIFQTKQQAEMFDERILKKSTIIPNPIKLGLPNPILPYSDRRKVIVNYCGFKVHKNIRLLLEAYNIAEKKHPDYYLELYGYGDNQAIIERIKELHLTDKVKILPFTNDIHTIVRDCSMFVMSSDYEGMPNALIEAMAIGLPVISTDCLGGGARALIENGNNGYLVPINDVFSLSSAILNLIENPEIASKFVKNALKIREDLDLNKIAHKWFSEISD